ncbi:MAG: RidA family protein [Desulfobacter sp.]|nr:RidA family protein [Desulfobacter sp.]WDP85057.1 MAG: RidA family protein [Desulfobacter sp.]
MKKTINTPLAPAAIGPYSQAIAVNDMLFLSGQLPINPVTSQMAPNDIEVQTKTSIENIAAILKQAGMDLNNVVKTTVFISDMNNFSKLNGVYGSYFQTNPPARSCFEVSRLPKDALVEIEAIAHK